jgi:hypothetical protein
MHREAGFSTSFGISFAPSSEVTCISGFGLVISVVPCRLAIVNSNITFFRIVNSNISYAFCFVHSRVLQAVFLYLSPESLLIHALQEYHACTSHIHNRK